MPRSSEAFHLWAPGCHISSNYLNNLLINLGSEGPERLDDVLNDLVECPEPLTQDQTHVDVLQVQDSNGHVGTEDQYQQDEVSEVSNDQCCCNDSSPHLETSSNMKTMPTMWRTRRNTSTTTQYKVFRLI